jgi:hypothetical protein
VLTHDDDLMMIYGLGHDSVSGVLNSSYISPSCWQSLETLEPDVMLGLLRRSNVEIQKVSSPTDGGPNTDRSVVKVAMLSTTLQNWSM